MENTISDRDTWLWNKRFDLVHKVQISISYHKKRERFYDLLDKTTKAIAIVAATSVLASIVGEQIKWAQLVIVFTSTLSLVFGWSSKSRLHSDLASKFSQIAQSMAQIGETSFTEENVKQWDYQINIIEATEPPSLSGVVRLCQDEFDLAHGVNIPQENLTIFRRVLVHFYFDPIPSPDDSNTNKN